MGLDVFLLMPPPLRADIQSAILKLYPKPNSTQAGYLTLFLTLPLSVFAREPPLCPHRPRAPSAATANSETY